MSAAGSRASNRRRRAGSVTASPPARAGPTLAEHANTPDPHQVSTRTKAGIYLLFLSVYLAFTAGHFRSTDEVAIYLTAQSLAERQSLAIKPIHDAALRPDERATK